MEQRFLDLCIKNRELLGLTIEDVAEILDILPSEYRKFEEGEEELDKDTMKKIVKLYCIDIKQFKDYSSLYDLSDVPSHLLDITKDIINMIEGDDNA